MTPRQQALLDYHRDLASFATNAKRPVFVVLDLDDPVGLEIASRHHPGCLERRDAIRASGAYPALTLTLPLKDANELLARGWPNARKIPAIPEGAVAMIVISDGRCLAALARRA